MARESDLGSGSAVARTLLSYLMTGEAQCIAERVALNIWSAVDQSEIVMQGIHRDVTSLWSGKGWLMSGASDNSQKLWLLVPTANYSPSAGPVTVFPAPSGMTIKARC